MSKNQLIGLSEAAALAQVTRWTIMEWERKGWLKAAKGLTPRKIGRPGKLYARKEVIETARSRGRNPESV